MLPAVLQRLLRLLRHAEHLPGRLLWYGVSPQCFIYRFCFPFFYSIKLPSLVCSFLPQTSRRWILILSSRMSTLWPSAASSPSTSSPWLATCSQASSPGYHSNSLRVVLVQRLEYFWIQPGPRFLWVPVLLRILFIPFFLLCNYQPLGVNRAMGVYIANDWAYWYAH